VGAHNHDATLHVHAKGMRVMFLAMQDRYDEALVAGQHAMPELPTGEPFADATLLNAMAHVTSVFFGKQARPLLAASRLQQGSTSNFNRMYSEASHGMLDLMQGQLRQATERFRQGLDATHAVTRHHAHGNAWAGVLYAHALYEANQLDAAEHLLNIYLPLARDVGLPDHMILSHAMGARLAQWRGNVDTAIQLLAELETLGHRRQMPRVVVAALLERAHLAITREQPAQSATLLAQAEDEAVWARERRQLLIAHETQYLRLAQLRWQLVFADAAQLKPVQQALKEEMALARANGRQRRLWVLQTWQAVAHERLGQWRDAQALLLNVLAQLAPEGYMRLLLDEGPMVARLLRRLQREAARELAAAPAVAAFADALVAALGPLGTLGDAELLEPATPCAVLSGEPLTQRERQVLQLLVDGYSNSAMAEKLFLSDSTVRTHLRSINAKLGARSRTHALALARKAGLL
jgi:LuxR family maltose regulon positive regulatory protein